MRRPLLVFFPSLTRGGCEEYAVAVGVEAQERGYEVFACFPHLAATQSIQADFRARGIATHDWQVDRDSPCDSWGSFPRQLREARLILGALKPERVWAAMPWLDAAPGFLAGCAEQRIGGLCVWQLATQTVSIAPADAERARQSVDEGIAWVAVSRNNRPFVARSYHLDEGRIQVIHNGLLRPDRCHSNSDQHVDARAGLRKALGLPQDALLAITISRLCIEQKGHDVLLKSICSLHDLDRLYFLWVGSGEDEAVLRQQVSALNLDGRVIFLGFRSDVVSLLKAADFFVLPSNIEGMPFSVLEALAFGCPVVTTRVGDLSELLVEGKHALLVSPGNATALAHAIRCVATDRVLAAKLSENALEIARQMTGQSMFSKSFALLERGYQDETRGTVRDNLSVRYQRM